MTMHLLKIKKKVKKSFPEQLHREKIEKIFAELINKFQKESEVLIKTMVRLILNSPESVEALENLFKLEWKEEEHFLNLLGKIRESMGKYGEMFKNKTHSVIFVKQLMLGGFGLVFEALMYVAKHIFHKKNFIKEYLPRNLVGGDVGMKRRSDTKEFLTGNGVFLRLLTRDFGLFQEFYGSLDFFIPKSNKVSSKKFSF